jgi:hypothetical protein
MVATRIQARLPATQAGSVRTARIVPSSQGLALGLIMRRRSSLAASIALARHKPHLIPVLGHP